MSRVVVPVLFVAVGIAIMLLGVVQVIPEGLGVIALAFGFLVVVAGLVVGMRDRISAKSTGVKGAKDRGARMRLGFVLLAAVSVALPYFRIPLEPNGLMATGADIPRAVAAGTTTTGVLVGLAFLTVLVAALFLSTFHHVGGYVLLLDVGALTFFLRRTAEIEPLTAFTAVYGMGLYVAVAAALGVVGSQFVTTTEDGSEYGWTHQ